MSTVGRKPPDQADWTPTIVNRNTAQSIPDNVFTAVSWSGEVWDAPNFHSPSTNPGQIKPENFEGPLPFLAVLQVRFASNNTGRRRARILKNGTETIADGGVSAVDFATGVVNLSAILNAWCEF
jgi:hypothetical protein